MRKEEECGKPSKERVPIPQELLPGMKGQRKQGGSPSGWQ